MKLIKFIIAVLVLGVLFLPMTPVSANVEGGIPPEIVVTFATPINELTALPREQIFANVTDKDEPVSVLTISTQKFLLDDHFCQDAPCGSFPNGKLLETTRKHTRYRPKP